MAEDLYGLLEVERGATDAEIKKNYRRLARKYHPDVNKDSGAEDRFKKIQKAYDILSDSNKKTQYDQFGVADDSPGGGAGFGGGFEGFSSGGFEDIFDAFFGGNRRSSGRQEQTVSRGEDLRYDMDLTLEEVVKGVRKTIEVYHLEKCSSCKGAGTASGSAPTSCSMCGGAGQVQQVQRTMLGSFTQVSTCPQCRGTGSQIKDPCRSCSGRGLAKKRKSIEVTIPAGVDTGTKLRVSGEGNYGERGGPAGDLYVFVNIKDHMYFKRDGQNVSMNIEVSVTDAILGTTVEVPTLNGKANLKIPPGTQPGTTMRLKGKGIPHVRGHGQGDQRVKVSVVIPETLNAKERDLIKELAELQAQDKESIWDSVKKVF